MNVSKSLLWLTLAVLFCWGSQRALAAPAPPQLVVNHETKQCAEFSAGDECVSCVPPAGWEILGNSVETECPAGYAQVEIVPICAARKVSFCCTEGHSGAPGDCEDVVINKATGQCAFVEDINRCPSLPGGWDKYGADCPYHDWAENVQCLDEEGGGGVAGGHLLGSYPPIVAAVVCLLACSVPTAVLCILLAVWLLRSRRRRSGPQRGADERRPGSPKVKRSLGARHTTSLPWR
jgi:hypothetical protein